MKKFLILMATIIVASFTNVNAITHVEGSKLDDNITVSLSVGGISPLNNTFDFANKSWKNQRLDWGIEVTKWFTPIMGFSISGNTNVNTTKSYTAFDESNVATLANVNLMNLFAGYKGEPRKFEIVAKAGTGWGHAYGEPKANFITYNTGADLNWHLNKNKSWMVSLKTKVVWSTFDYATRTMASRFTINRAALGIGIGLTYKLNNSNGTHNFKNCNKRYTEEEMNLVIAERDKAIAERDLCESSRNALAKSHDNLEESLRIAKTQAEEKGLGNDTLPTYVYFLKNSSDMDDLQTNSIFDIVDFLKENPSANIDIVGFADKATGTPEINKLISERRAQIVADNIVKSGIDANRIKNIIGKGDTEQPFAENDKNRVVLTILVQD